MESHGGPPDPTDRDERPGRRARLRFTERDDFPAWVYRAATSLLLCLLLGAVGWVGNRIIIGIDQTAASVSVVREQLIRLESRLDDQDRRLNRMEAWRDSWRSPGGQPQP